MELAEGAFVLAPIGERQTDELFIDGQAGHNPVASSRQRSTQRNSSFRASCETIPSVVVQIHVHSDLRFRYTVSVYLSRSLTRSGSFSTI